MFAGSNNNISKRQYLSYKQFVEMINFCKKQRETFDAKRNEIQVRINRLKNKITAHEKADNSFDETILGLLDIATQAGNIFDRSQNLELKRLLLKFVFESLTLTEGVLSYKLKFPFDEFVNANILMAQASKLLEPNQTFINQALQGNDNENLQIGSLKSYEPQILDKKQEVTSKNATSLQIGEPDGIRTHDPLIKSQMLYRLSYEPIS